MTNKFVYKIINQKECIFDVVRKKYVVLTKEEWVRQQILHYLIYSKKYPLSLLSVEKQLIVGNLKKRYDIVVYKNSLPWMIIECKEERVQLDKHSLSQVLSYSSQLKIKYIALTNGTQLFCYHIESNCWENQFPEYE